jgi:hypothetical protein
MCQFQNRNSQFLPTHPTDKIDHPPKNLPWTDKFCHFVRFETRTLPKSERQRGCVTRLCGTPLTPWEGRGLRNATTPFEDSGTCHSTAEFGGCVMRNHPGVIPAKAGIQRMDIGLHYSVPDAPSNGGAVHCVPTDRWIPAFAGMTTIRQGCVMQYSQTMVSQDPLSVSLRLREDLLLPDSCRFERFVVSAFCFVPCVSVSSVVYLLSDPQISRPVTKAFPHESLTTILKKSFRKMSNRGLAVRSMGEA